MDSPRETRAALTRLRSELDPERVLDTVCVGDALGLHPHHAQSVVVEERRFERIFFEKRGLQLFPFRSVAWDFDSHALHGRPRDLKGCDLADVAGVNQYCDLRMLDQVF